MVAQSKWWRRPNGGGVQMVAASKWWRSPNGGKINILNENNIFTGDVRFCVCVMKRQNHYREFKQKYVFIY
jgi:hypothetical protein